MKLTERPDLDPQTTTIRAPRPSPPPPALEIVDPLTGEVIDREDADALIDAFERINEHAKEVYAAKTDVASAIADLTSGDAKTRRVKGQRRKAKVEMPSATWNQSKLKEAFNAYPQHRDDYLKIGSISPKLTPIKQMESTTGEKDFQMFRSLVLGAKREPTGAPRVTIEE